MVVEETRMRFENPSPAEIESLLRKARTIAVVGLSDRPHRTSHGVSAAMQRFGYRILPVNPLIREALGEPAFPTLAAAKASLPAGERIDIVDVFRRSEHVAGIVDECLALGLPAIWLQEGVVDAAAAGRARAAGVTVVMDRCLYKDRARIGAGGT